jgi:hypothetical protein
MGEAQLRYALIMPFDQFAQSSLTMTDIFNQVLFPCPFIKIGVEVSLEFAYSDLAPLILMVLHMSRLRVDTGLPLKTVLAAHELFAELIISIFEKDVVFGEQIYR